MFSWKGLSITNLVLENKQSINNLPLRYRCLRQRFHRKRNKSLIGRVDLQWRQCAFPRSTFGYAIFGNEDVTSAETVIVFIYSSSVNVICPYPETALRGSHSNPPEDSNGTAIRVLRRTSENYFQVWQRWWNAYIQYIPGEYEDTPQALATMYFLRSQVAWLFNFQTLSKCLTPPTKPPLLIT
jgi:hypothetical protein